MGATSVTGVGFGSSEGLNRGSEHMSIGVAHIVGPRIVAAESFALTSGNWINGVVVNFPALTGSGNLYQVHLTNVFASGSQYVSGGLPVPAHLNGASGLVITSGANTSFGVSCGSGCTNTVNWSVVRVGIGPGSALT